eukprot:CAMPEP_0172527726 /NCGR_PEP_ID=MMETSP1067-20121228/2336_1 /TAXON_ID=265564 ORGANISM="Thalassiosira punctigera, Strain Tpunct2005C2" /NCGR_SAMPLE_ID=MMETSP1067 /ASSEMBLY_ACC=CAM_ASM_000444 /LENGTH=224 /DNA_ID=CAMNT_0013311521 /DNA_START=91 /DNA_END=765 /DNA_ORIENTATION=+
MYRPAVLTLIAPTGSLCPLFGTADVVLNAATVHETQAQDVSKGTVLQNPADANGIVDTINPLTIKNLRGVGAILRKGGALQGNELSVRDTEAEGADTLVAGDLDANGWCAGKWCSAFYNLNIKWEDGSKERFSSLYPGPVDWSDGGSVKWSSAQQMLYYEDERDWVYPYVSCYNVWGSYPPPKMDVAIGTSYVRDEGTYKRKRENKCKYRCVEVDGPGSSWWCS